MDEKATLYYDLSPQSCSCLMLIHLLDIDDVKLCDVEKIKNDRKYMIDAKNVPPVPALVIQDLVLVNSHTILMYLCEAHNDISYFPEDSEKRSHIIHRLQFEAKVMQEFYKTIVENIKQKHMPTALHNSFKRKTQKIYTELNTFLTLWNYVAANTLTIADIAILSTVSVFDMLFPIYESIENWPNLWIWFNRMRKMSAYNLNEGVIEHQRQLFLHYINSRKVEFALSDTEVCTCSSSSSSKCEIGFQENSVKFAFEDELEKKRKTHITGEKIKAICRKHDRCDLHNTNVEVRTLGGGSPLTDKASQATSFDIAEATRRRSSQNLMPRATESAAIQTDAELLPTDDLFIYGFSTSKTVPREVTANNYQDFKRWISNEMQQLYQENVKKMNYSRIQALENNDQTDNDARPNVSNFMEDSIKVESPLHSSRKMSGNTYVNPADIPDKFRTFENFDDIAYETNKYKNDINARNNQHQSDENLLKSKEYENNIKSDKTREQEYNKKSDKTEKEDNIKSDKTREQEYYKKLDKTREQEYNKKLYTIREREDNNMSDNTRKQEYNIKSDKTREQENNIMSDKTREQEYNKKLHKTREGEDNNMSDNTRKQEYNINAYESYEEEQNINFYETIEEENSMYADETNEYQNIKVIDKSGENPVYKKNYEKYNNSNERKRYQKTEEEIESENVYQLDDGQLEAGSKCNCSQLSELEDSFFTSFSEPDMLERNSRDEKVWESCSCSTAKEEISHNSFCSCMRENYNDYALRNQRDFTIGYSKNNTRNQYTKRNDDFQRICVEFLRSLNTCRCDDFADSGYITTPPASSQSSKDTSIVSDSCTCTTKKKVSEKRSTSKSKKTAKKTNARDNKVKSEKKTKTRSNSKGRKAKSISTKKNSSTTTKASCSCVTKDTETNNQTGEINYLKAASKPICRCGNSNTQSDSQMVKRNGSKDLSKTTCKCVPSDTYRNASINGINGSSSGSKPTCMCVKNNESNNRIKTPSNSFNDIKLMCSEILNHLRSQKESHLNEQKKKQARSCTCKIFNDTDSQSSQDSYANVTKKAESCKCKMSNDLNNIRTNNTKSSDKYSSLNRIKTQKNPFPSEGNRNPCMCRVIIKKAKPPTYNEELPSSRKFYSTGSLSSEEEVVSKTTSSKNSSKESDREDQYKEKLTDKGNCKCRQMANERMKIKQTNGCSCKRTSTDYSDSIAKYSSAQYKGQRAGTSKETCKCMLKMSETNSKMNDKVKAENKIKPKQKVACNKEDCKLRNVPISSTSNDSAHRKTEISNEQLEEQVKQKIKSKEAPLSSVNSIKKSEEQLPQFQEKDTQTDPVFKQREISNDQIDEKVKQKVKSKEAPLSSPNSIKKFEEQLPQFQEKDTQTDPVYKQREILNDQMDDKVKSMKKSEEQSPQFQEKDTQTDCNDSTCKVFHENLLNKYPCDDTSCKKKPSKTGVKNEILISDANKDKQILPRENKNKTESKEKIISQSSDYSTHKNMSQISAEINNGEKSNDVSQDFVKVNNKIDSQKSDNDKEQHCNCCKCKEMLNAKNEKETAEEPANVSYGWVSWFAPGDCNYSNWMVDEIKKKNLENNVALNILPTNTLNDASLANNMMPTTDNNKILNMDNSKDEMDTYSSHEKSNIIQSNRNERKLSVAISEEPVMDKVMDLHVDRDKSSKYIDDNKISHTANNDEGNSDTASHRISMSTQTEEWVQDEEGRYSYIPYTPYRRRTIGADDELSPESWKSNKDANRHKGGQHDRNSEDDNENFEYESASHNVVLNENDGSNKTKQQYLRSTENNIEDMVSEGNLEYKSKSYKKIKNGNKVNEPMLKSAAAQHNFNSSNNEKSLNADFIQKKSEKIMKYFTNSKKKDDGATCSYSPKQKNQDLNIIRSRKSQFEGCTYLRKKSLPTRSNNDGNFKEIPFKCPIKPANERLNSLSRQCPKLYTRRESVVRSFGVPSNCSKQSESVKENNLRQVGGKGKDFVCCKEQNNLNSRNVNSSHRIEHCYFQEPNSKNYTSKPSTSKGNNHRTPTIYKFNQNNNTFYLDDDLKQGEAYPTSKEYNKFANFSSEMNTTPMMPTPSMQKRQAHIHRFNNLNERNNTEYSQQCGKPMYNNYVADHAPMPPSYKSNHQVIIPSSVNFNGAMSQRRPKSARVRF